MAKRPTEVTLSLDDCEPNALPPVCCKCGEPATCEKQVKFSWYPPWIVLTVLIALIIAVILAAILRKKRTAYLPVCDKHSGVWNWGGAIMAFTAISFVGLLVGGLALFGGPGMAAFAAPLFIALLVYFVVGFFTGVIVQAQAIQPKFITDDELKLVKLHPEFADAVIDQQDAEAEEYRAARAAKRKPA